MPRRQPSAPRSTTGARPPSPQEPSPSPIAGGFVIGLLVLTALFVLTQLYSAIPLIGPVGDDLGGGVTFALATCFSLCYAAGFLIWGPVSDHYGRRRLMVPGVLALALATFACAFAPSVLWLGVLRGVQGLAAASFAPVALAYLTEATAPRHRGIAIGAMSTAFLVAGIFGQVFASYVSLRLGWPWVFGLSGLVLALACVMVVLTVSEVPRREVSSGLGERFAALGRVVVRPSVLLLCCAHVTLLLSFVGMYTALGPHLGAFDLDPSNILLLRLVGLPAMFLALSVGPLSRRLGMAGVARAGFLLSAVGMGLEALLSQSLVGVCAASVVFVSGVALAIPAMITLFGEAAAPERAGGMALTGFVLFVGASLGPLVAAAVGGFALLLAGFTALLTVAALCVTMFDRSTGKEGVET